MQAILFNRYLFTNNEFSRTVTGMDSGEAHPVKKVRERERERERERKYIHQDGAHQLPSDGNSVVMF